MTEADFEAAKLRVYEEFGIWKPGEKCEGKVNRTWKGCHCYKCGFDCGHPSLEDFEKHHYEHQHAHDIPPPELTDAVAWQVLVEARHRIDCMVPLQKWLFTSDGTPGALILTLAGAGQGAHEA